MTGIPGWASAEEVMSRKPTGPCAGMSAYVCNMYVSVKDSGAL